MRNGGLIGAINDPIGSNDDSGIWELVDVFYTIKEYGQWAFLQKFFGSTGLFGGGSSSSELNIIDYVTISTPSNATDFGDLTVARTFLASCSDGTYGLFGGGSPTVNIIDYVTISTPSNATDFGDLTVARYASASCSGN